MSTKVIRKKGKRKLKENGEPMPYQKLDKTDAKSIRAIQGIYKAWKKAPKYLMRLDSTEEIRWYLSNDNTLTIDRKLARVFSKGFDDPEVKREYWSKRLGVKFRSENA